MAICKINPKRLQTEQVRFKTRKIPAGVKPNMLAFMGT